MAFSAAWFVYYTYMPFIRARYSDSSGALIEKSARAVFRYYFSESKDLISLRLNWGRPPYSDLCDQYTAELFYKLQLFQNLAITPYVQLIINPALNPE